MTASAILIWLAGALLVVLVGLILVPFRLNADLRASPHLSYRVDAALLDGRLPSLRLVDGPRPRAAQRDETQTRPARGGADIRMLAALPDLAAGLLRVIRIDRAAADIEFGLADPADTGLVYGCLAPLQYGPACSFRLRPNFAGPVFVGEIEASIRVAGIRLLPPIGRFLWRAFGPAR